MVDEENDPYIIPELVELPITDELDLHTFRPSEMGSLIPEYLRACQVQGFNQVRIIHGKGTGALREGVHAILKRDERVIDFRLGDQTSGGWGATLVRLQADAGSG